jgi:CDP-4-dehydro-6-deoxyglucose reductase, E3
LVGCFQAQWRILIFTPNKMYRITLSSGVSYSAEVDVSILNAASISGVSLPYSCKTGRCSTCKCKVFTGETKAIQEEIGLSASEKAEGLILTCVRTAVTDLSLDVEDLGGVVIPEARTLPCRINSSEKLAHDVIKVMLRLPPTADFSFIPGQYIDVIGPSGVRRSYSLANARIADNQLELHIRAVDGGSMSQYWFGQSKVNDLLRLNGPLGTFFLRDLAGLDLVFLATGTGIAPVKAMLESIHENNPEKQPRSVTIFWGGRTPQDLYFDVMEIPGRFRYVPVLSRADAHWTGIRGHVQQALLAELPDLRRATVYACGSDAMIRDAQATLTAAGLPSNRFYSDAFVCSATN